MRSKYAFAMGRWAVLLAAFAGAPAFAQTQGLRKVVVPSPAFRTIQQGIDAVAAGGAVHIKPGTYQETLIVAKEVSLIGAGAQGADRTEIVGARPTEVVPVDRATAIVTFIAGGGGEIKALALRGGHVGILGIATENRSPAALEVKDLIIEDSGRGILGSFSELTVKETRIRNTLWNGASLLEGQIKILGSNILGALGAGLLVLNSTGTGSIEISDSNFVGNAGPGIIVFGGAKSVSIHDCDVLFNHEAGIKLVGVGACTIANCSTSLTLPNADGNFGEGVGLFDCDAVALIDSNLAFNAFGVLDFGSGLFFGNDLFNSNGISLDGETYLGVNPSVTDLGGNLCYEVDPNDGQVHQIACQVKSSQIVPPSPKPDP
jgi:Right handed beta helix region